MLIGSVAGMVVFYLVQANCFFAYARSAAKRLFKDTFHSVIRTKLAFFDTTPQGRIINRLVKDCESIDMVFPRFAYLFLIFTCVVCGLALVICIVTWPCILVIIPCVAIYAAVFLQFRSVTPSIRRVEGITRSNVFSNCQETLDQLVTIRAFNVED